MRTSVPINLDSTVEAESTRRFDRLKAPSVSRGSRSQLPEVEASAAELWAKEFHATTQRQAAEFPALGLKPVTILP